jgi:5-(carboxyamino)imidazole ribonucleotide mutase
MRDPQPTDFSARLAGGIPVACVAIGASGATNAAYLAGQILAVADKNLAARIQADRAAIAEAVSRKDKMLQAKLAESKHS